MAKTEFVVYPPALINPWLLAFLIFSVITPLLVIAYGWLGARNSRLLIQPPLLRVKVPFYRRDIPLAAVVPTSLRSVSLDTDTEFAPTIRTNGIAIGDLRLGWFRLKSGKSALLCITAKQPAVYFETNEGFSVLMTVVDVERCMSAIHSSASESQ